MRTRELHEDGLEILAIEGEIDLSCSPELREILHCYVKAKCPALILDFKEVAYVDSSALATLIEYVRDAQKFGGRLAIAQLNERVQTIFDIVRLGEFFPIHATIADAKSRPPRSAGRVKSYFTFIGRIAYWTILAPLRGQPFKVSEVFHQMVLIGVRALPMAALTAFSIGLTLAMQSGAELRRMGALSYVPSLVSISLLRELGPLLIAVIVIGRSGSAVTAELGAMQVSEEIEALEVMAINPIRFLIVPRVLAMLVMLPALTVFGDWVGMVGGWSICHFAMDFDTSAYILGSLHRAHAWDFQTGLIKSVVFAWLIITIACHMGLEVRGGAEGVGQATTGSVVWSLLMTLIANAILTGIFFFAT